MGRLYRVFGACLIASLLSGLVPQMVTGQEVSAASARAEADAAISQLRSPYCPGLMLENCPSSAAGLLRDSIYALAAEGASTEQLVEWMLARHGEEYRGVPLRRGAGLFAWVMPPLALLAAIGVVVLWFRSSRKPVESTVSNSPGALINDAEREELAQALRDWESSGDAGR